LGAVPDVHSPIHAERLRANRKLGEKDHYFNAGILVIDLVRWQEEQVTERAYRYLEENPNSHLSDQDALNVVCRGRWKELDTLWNFQTFHDDPPVFSSGQPGIVHFVGPGKPWDARSLNTNASLYNSFSTRTCFAKTPLSATSDALIGAWCRWK